MVKITAKQVESVLLGVAVGDALGVPVEFTALWTPPAGLQKGVVIRGNKRVVPETA
jgi:hypothetical protein